MTAAGVFNTSNTTVKVSTSTKVFWLVTFTSTNQNQIGRNSVCLEAIDATLTGQFNRNGR